MSLSLLQGHFYLLCTVTVIANLVNGGEGAIASFAPPVTRALHKIGGHFIHNGCIHYRCGVRRPCNYIWRG